MANEISANTQYSRLTKVGAVILAMTLVFSLLFIVLGIVFLVDENSSKDDNKSQMFYVYENSTKNISVDAYEYYDLQFTPSYSGNYVINIDGATVSSVTTSSGAPATLTILNGTQNGYYDYSYEVYLYSAYTYTIRVYSNSSSITFYMYRQ